MREADKALSKSLGGYRSGREELSVYGKYVEPVAHAAVHTARGVERDGWGLRMNQAEWARAKDEIKMTGTGLHKMDLAKGENVKYQMEHRQARDAASRQEGPSNGGSSSGRTPSSGGPPSGGPSSGGTSSSDDGCSIS